MNATQILERLNAISNSLNPITTARLVEIDKEKRELLLSCSEVATKAEFEEIEKAYRALHVKCADLYMQIGIAEDRKAQEFLGKFKSPFFKDDEELFFWTQGNNGSIFAPLVVVAKDEESARQKMAHYRESYLPGCDVQKHKITDKFEAKTYSFIVQ